jgi:hypothetical protein
VIGVSGCASPPLSELGAPPQASSGPSLAIAPLPVRYEASATGPGAAEAFFPPYRPRIDIEAATEEFVDLLKRRAGYERVTLLDLDPKASGTERRAAAKAAQAAWLLEASMEDVYVRLKRKPTGMHAFKIAVLIVSSILLFPAVDPLNWFLPGEDYELVYTLQFRLSDVSSGEEVAAGYLELGAWDSFAAFPPAPTRTWFILGFLRTPGCFDQEDWIEVGEKLALRAHHELIVGIVRALEAPLRQR